MKNRIYVDIHLNVRWWYYRMVNNIYHHLVKLAISFIVWRAKNSYYISFAKKEFELLKYSNIINGIDNDDDDTGYQKSVIELLSLYDQQDKIRHNVIPGDGGRLSMFNKLVRFKILSPLTFCDDEFKTISVSNGQIIQNRRSGNVFKSADNGRVTYNDGLNYKIKCYTDDSMDDIVDYNNFTYDYDVPYFVPTLNADGKISYVIGGYVRDLSDFDLESYKCIMSAYKIKCPDGKCVFIADGTDVKKSGYEDKYDVVYANANTTSILFNTLIGYDDNKYRDYILNKISVVGKHIYGDSFILNEK